MNRYYITNRWGEGLQMWREVEPDYETQHWPGHEEITHWDGDGMVHVDRDAVADMLFTMSGASITLMGYDMLIMETDFMTGGLLCRANDETANRLFLDKLIWQTNLHVWWRMTHAKFAFQSSRFGTKETDVLIYRIRCAIGEDKQQFTWDVWDKAVNAS